MTNFIRIDTPQSASEFADRNQLLATTMRDSELSWSYCDEYPLVLAPNALKTSFCIFSNQTVIAHINIWIRTITYAAEKLTSKSPQRIALIGNVATHPNHRGQGHIRSLMTHAAEVALSHGANAIVLWSDLLEFYQTLGFRSIGRETRYVFNRYNRACQTGIQRTDIANLSDQDLQKMMDIRPKFPWNVGRSIDEFRALLSIPACNIFIRKKGAQIQSWLVIGKGSDMVGVVHEWGVSSPDELMTDLQSIMNLHDVAELTLLAGNALQNHWHKVFSLRAQSSSNHSMALAKPLNASGEVTLNHLAQSFIWGLDSI